MFVRTEGHGMDALKARAYAAYFKTEGREAAQPSEVDSGEIEHGGKQYVALRNRNGILAIYRVRNDGMLKRLRRWPAALEER